jgi:hypothetical protein
MSLNLMDVFDIRNPDDHEKVVLLALRRLVFGPSGTCPVSDNDVLNVLHSLRWRPSPCQSAMSLVTISFLS